VNGVVLELVGFLLLMAAYRLSGPSVQVKCAFDQRLNHIRQLGKRADGKTKKD